MKVTKSFTLSQDAVERLPDENASQFVDEAIRAYKHSPPWNSLEYRIDQLEKKLDEILQKRVSVADAPSDTSLEANKLENWEIPPCCSETTPCKHWVYNGAEETWTNIITGQVRKTDNA